jgi:hypothetical protein
LALTPQRHRRRVSQPTAPPRPGRVGPDVVRAGRGPARPLPAAQFSGSTRGGPRRRTRTGGRGNL